MTDFLVCDLGRVFRIAAAVLAAVLLLSDPAGAGTLRVDVNAMPDWHGSELFQSEFGLPAFEFLAEVDYAVYAPSKFEDTFGPGSDPSGGQDYVYAYQIFNTGSDLPLPAGNDAIYLFTLGLTGDEVVRNIGAVDMGSGLMPVLSSFQGGDPTFTSALWSYVQTPLSPGTPSPETKILIFTSPSGPELDTSTLLASFTADTQ